MRHRTWAAMPGQAGAGAAEATTIRRRTGTGNVEMGLLRERRHDGLAIVEMDHGKNPLGPEMVAELYVQVGDEVAEGAELAMQGDLEQLEAAVASDELALLQAQQDLDALHDGADLATAEALLALANAQDARNDAQRTWQYQQEGYRGSTVTIEAAEAELVLARAQLDRAERTANSKAGLPNDDPERAQAFKDYAAAQTRYNQALASKGVNNIIGTIITSW